MRGFDLTKMDSPLTLSGRSGRSSGRSAKSGSGNLSHSRSTSSSGFWSANGGSNNAQRFMSGSAASGSLRAGSNGRGMLHNGGSKYNPKGSPRKALNHREGVWSEGQGGRRMVMEEGKQEKSFHSRGHSLKDLQRFGPQVLPSRERGGDRGRERGRSAGSSFKDKL